MYEPVPEARSLPEDTPAGGGYDEGTFAPPEAIALMLIERLTDQADGPVPYEWVIGRARREYDLDRPAVERSVECLVREGVVEKVGADRLVVA